MSLLEAREVTSGYGEMMILHEFGLHAESGEIVCLIGPNGAGKSTFLKTLFGLLKPTRGHVVFNGEDITGLRPDLIVRRGICYVPQSHNVFASLTVRENLEMGAYIRNDDVRESMEAVFDRFPVLREKIKLPAGSLSGGEQQMVAMGRALMLDPKMLLLDEPSAGLAPNLVQTIFEKIQAIRDSGVAVVMVEQNARAALALADRGYVLAMGRNRYPGTGRELLDDPEIGALYLGG